jgi:hypothetical protein
MFQNVTVPKQTFLALMARWSRKWMFFGNTQRRPLWTWRGSRSSARDGHGTIPAFPDLFTGRNKLLLSVARSSSSGSSGGDDQQATGLEQQRLVVVICCVYICKWTLERYFTDRLDSQTFTNVTETSDFYLAVSPATQMFANCKVLVSSPDWDSST